MEVSVIKREGWKIRANYLVPFVYEITIGGDSWYEESPGDAIALLIDSGISYAQAERLVTNAN